MNSKERVRIALDHMRPERPDRVPIGFSSTPEAKEKLKNYLDIYDDGELLKRLGVDYRLVSPEYIGPKDKNWGMGIYTPGKDIWGVERRTVKNPYGEYLEISKYPLENIKTIEELDKYPWPKIEWFNFDSIKNQLDKLEEEDDYWIRMEISGSVLGYAWYMRGFDKFLLDMADNPILANKIMGKIYDFWVSITVETLLAANGRIDMVGLADDIGGQEGMLISPEMWREMIKPWYKKFFSCYHKYGVKILYHSCGSIGPIIGELAEIGVDVLNPLQFYAKGFPNKKELKEKYGKKLSFNGGMDIVRILPFGTVDEIKKETINIINILGKDGGFILETSHGIQPDTPPKNIMAMYDTAIDYKY